MPTLCKFETLLFQLNDDLMFLIHCCQVNVIDRHNEQAYTTAVSYMVAATNGYVATAKCFERCYGFLGNIKLPSVPDAVFFF